jgi:glucose-fructose oxidoreductase
MAVTEKECEQMVRAAEQGNIKLMIAYRLHFEEANLKAIELVNSGKLGEPRIFNSTFTMQVKEGNIRTKKELGGGSLYDIGVYCINAARYLFRSEPTEVVAFSASNDDNRFAEIDEMTSAVLRFPGERLAAFTCSFGAADVSSYQVVGTKGTLRADPAYEYAGELKLNITINDKKQKREYGRRDQFAAELSYFSDCILTNRNPEPSGVEGLADVRIINALYRSAKSGKLVKLGDFEKTERPKLEQEDQLPPVREPELVNVEAPSEG